MSDQTPNKNDKEKIAAWINLFYKKYNKAPNVSQIKTALGSSMTDIANTLQTFNFVAHENNKKNSESLLNKKIPKHYFIIILLSIIAICCIIISAFFTEKALYENFKNHFFSWGLAMSIISIVAIGRAVSLLLKEKKAFFIAFIVNFVWCIALVYSMYSTLSVQFAEFYDKLQAYKQDTKETSLSIKKESSNKQQKDLIDKRIKELTDKETGLNEELILLKSKESNPKIESIIKQKEKEANNFYVSKNKLYDELKQLIDNEVADIETKETQQKPLQKSNSYLFFVWLSDTFKINNPDALQFISFVFPTLFIDIIAPICLLVVTILQGTYVKNSLLKKIKLVFNKNKKNNNI